jgi:hypothetical protein
MIAVTYDQRAFEGLTVVYVLRSLDDKFDSIIGVFDKKENAVQCSEECGGNHELTITEMEPCES